MVSEETRLSRRRRPTNERRMEGVMALRTEVTENKNYDYCSQCITLRLLFRISERLKHVNNYQVMH